MRIGLLMLGLAALVSFPSSPAALASEQSLSGRGQLAAGQLAAGQLAGQAGATRPAARPLGQPGRDGVIAIAATPTSDETAQTRSQSWTAPTPTGAPSAPVRSPAPRPETASSPGPTVSPTVTPVTPPASERPGIGLPVTGAQVGGMVLLGTGLLAGGFAMLAVRRRRLPPDLM
jgi:LPXTG-motif cell wall-anchored protein